MADKSYSINFDGYWREPNINGLPTEAGIYCVYACTYDSQEGTVSISKLLYIGESDNVWKRVKNHEKTAEWKRQLGRNGVLCFNASTTAVLERSGDRERVEAAMIFRHKPPCNVEYKNTFPFDRTTVTITGRSAELDYEFTVGRSRYR